MLGPFNLFSVDRGTYVNIYSKQAVEVEHAKLKLMRASETS